MKHLWSIVLNWLEHGDLVPLIVIVSAVHYAVILRAYDYWPVAIAIGLLVDLGHFRTVRAAVRYSGTDLRTRAVRIAMAVFMTVVAFSYQQRFYHDWVLSLPLPLLIASLAWQQHVDQRTGKRETVQEPAQAPQVAPEIANDVSYVCVTCGRGFASQQGLAAHSRAHLRVKRNGHEREHVSMETVG